jgi:hypothetical protein
VCGIGFAQSLECLVLLASVRRSLFQTDEKRAGFLQALTFATREILKSHAGRLRDSNCFHQFCRLLYRIKTNTQIDPERFGMRKRAMRRAKARGARLMAEDLSLIATVDAPTQVLSETVQSLAKEQHDAEEKAEKDQEQMELRVLDGLKEWITLVSQFTIEAFKS